MRLLSWGKKEKDNQNITKERAQQITIIASTGSDGGGGIAEERAMTPDTQVTHYFSNQPPQGLSEGPPRICGGGSYCRAPGRPPRQTVGASSSGPPPPPSSGLKIMATSMATQTSKPEQFDMTIDDDVLEAHDGTSKVFAEQERAVLERKREVTELLAQHLGQQASTADQSYVPRLTDR